MWPWNRPEGVEPMSRATDAAPFMKQKVTSRSSSNDIKCSNMVGKLQDAIFLDELNTTLETIAHFGII